MAQVTMDALRSAVLVPDTSTEKQNNLDPRLQLSTVVCDRQRRQLNQSLGQLSRMGSRTNMWVLSGIMTKALGCTRLELAEKTKAYWLEAAEQQIRSVTALARALLLAAGMLTPDAVSMTIAGCQSLQGGQAPLYAAIECLLNGVRAVMEELDDEETQPAAQLDRPQIDIDVDNYELLRDAWHVRDMLAESVWSQTIDAGRILEANWSAYLRAHARKTGVDEECGIGMESLLEIRRRLEEMDAMTDGFMVDGVLLDTLREDDETEGDGEMFDSEEGSNCERDVPESRASSDDLITF